MLGGWTGREGCCLQTPSSAKSQSSKNNWENPKRARKTTFWESKQGESLGRGRWQKTSLDMELEEVFS